VRWSNKLAASLRSREPHFDSLVAPTTLNQHTRSLTSYQHSPKERETITSTGSHPSHRHLAPSLANAEIWGGGKEGRGGEEGKCQVVILQRE
jgi:hypothetical protein